MKCAHSTVEHFDLKNPLKDKHKELVCDKSDKYLNKGEMDFVNHIGKFEDFCQLHQVEKSYGSMCKEKMYSKFSTDLYRKPTDKPKALLPPSCHPGHKCKNIVYSMAFRLMRICSEETTFLKRKLELKYKYLIPRGYKSGNTDF